MLGPVRIIAILFVSLSSYSQSPAGGSLTVQVNVGSSVGLFVQPNGEQSIVVANAPDPKQSFSQKPAVQFHLADRRTDLDTRKETVVMDVGSPGKKDYQQVVVTTVVTK